jgi:hypothetical protein
MQPKEDDPDTQSGSSSLFFLPISQRIVMKADLSIPNIKKLHRRVPDWKSDPPQEGPKPLTDAIAAHLSK